MSTICLKCGVATAVGPEMGHMGLPSLDETPRGRGRHRLSSSLSSGGDADTDETFGCLYSGLAAVGLLTHPIETYREFLTEHTGKGHRLYEWVEEYEELPGDYQGMDVQFHWYERPRRAPGFIWARVRFSCTKCEETYESSAAEWVRPFEAHALTAESVRLFRRRAAEPSEHNIHDAWPFQMLLFDDLEDWLRRHARHTVSIELVGEGTARSGTVKRPPKKAADAGEPMLAAPDPWKPPATPPEEDERLLGALSDESLPLLAGLHNRDATVRSDSAKAVGRRGEPGTLAYLVPLLDDPAEQVRIAAVEAIGAVPDPRRVRPLGVALLDESEAVRKVAQEALSRNGIAESEALEKACSPRAPVDDKLQRAGTKVGTADRLTPILREGVHPHHSWRGHAARRLRRIRDQRAVPMIVAMLWDYSDYVVDCAAETAGVLRVREAVEPLLVAAANSLEERNALERARRARSILEALGKIGDPRGHPALLLALEDEESSVRQMALDALAVMRGPDAAKVLLKAVESKQEDVRRHAAYLLGKKREMTAVPTLVAALGDKEYLVRWEASEALVSIGDPDGLEAILEAAAKGDATVALSAHEFLIGRGDSRTEGALVEALREARRRDFGPEVATRYILSGNQKLASAGREALRGRKPSRGVKPILWGSERG